MIFGAIFVDLVHSLSSVTVTIHDMEEYHLIRPRLGIFKIDIFVEVLM